MRILFVGTFLVMTSCGLLQSYTDVTYDPDVLSKYDEVTRIRRFRSAELDTLFESTTETGMAKYEWTINNKGEVKKVKLVKSTFSDSLQTKFLHAIENAEEVPFENEGLFSRVITIRIKNEHKRHMTWSYPKRAR